MENEAMRALLVRQGDRAVRVWLRPDPYGWRLVQLEAVAGAVPPWEHLAGELFLDEEGVERAVRAAFAGLVDDTLSLVRIDEQAYRDWLALAQDSVARAQAAGRTVDPDALPYEQAQVRPEGSLVIYLQLPWEQVSLVVPPGR